MAEYIEREALITKFKKMELGEHGLVERLFADGVYAVIAAFPTADVAPVTRCKDCKHFKSYGTTSLRIDGKNIKAGWCHRRARYDEEYRMPPDGFCSYGERKDGT